MNKFIEQLKWRYATKRMNGNNIDNTKLDTIFEAIQLTPSSLGLMPYNVLIIQNKAIKNKLLEACNNQPQITECGCLLVFATWNNIGESKIDDHISLHKSINNISEANLQGLKTMMLNATQQLNNEQFKIWASKQVYIALGFALAAATMEEVDSTPMEGFNADKINDILELHKLNLNATVLLALGYRDNNTDYLVNLKKVRRDKQHIFISYL